MYMYVYIQVSLKENTGVNLYIYTHIGCIHVYKSKSVQLVIC